MKDRLHQIQDKQLFKKKKTDVRKKLDEIRQAEEKQHYAKLLLSNRGFIKTPTPNKPITYRKAPKNLAECARNVDAFIATTVDFKSAQRKSDQNGHVTITLDDSVDSGAASEASTKANEDEPSNSFRPKSGPLVTVAMVRKKLLVKSERNQKYARKQSLTSASSPISSVASSPARPVRLTDSELPESSRLLKTYGPEFSAATELIERLTRQSISSRLESSESRRQQEILHEKTKAREVHCWRFHATATQNDLMPPVIPSYYPGISRTEEPDDDFSDPPIEEIEEYIEANCDGVGRTQVLVEAYDIPITKKDLETLEGLNWLNDEVINFYFNLIKERADSSDEHPKVYIFSTFFYAKLCSSPNSYQTLKRWTRKVDLFSFDMLLIPVHLGMHWTLIGVNCRKQRITYYDSMNGGPANQGGERHLDNVLAYLQKEHSAKKNDALPPGWKVNDLGLGDDDQELTLPQQMNGSDCGMFTCKFADYLSLGKPFSFSQDNMPYYRRRMIYEILTKTLYSRLK
ncbi:Sentrin-specific protease 1 [Halotydeus destructor]|nr:Sentrin-specific protease 1 [Halotydeus destructor]